jgi:hypothetical protein
VAKQARAELVQHLGEQLEFLRASAAAFDGGQEAEAKRMATTIRLLVHNTKRSAGLLKQLGVQHQILFPDTAHRPPPPGVRIFHSGLAIIQMNNEEARFKPRLADDHQDGGYSPQSFRIWWNRPILQDLLGEWFTRKEIVLFMANQDGGAHVDPEIKPRWHALTRLNSLGWGWRREDEGSAIAIPAGPDHEPMGNPLPANIRQIAYEVEQTISEQLAHLL